MLIVSFKLKIINYLCTSVRTQALEASRSKLDIKKKFNFYE